MESRTSGVRRGSKRSCCCGNGLAVAKSSSILPALSAICSQQWLREQIWLVEEQAGPWQVLRLP